MSDLRHEWNEVASTGTLGQMTMVGDRLLDEVERLRAENERLLALENGDWKARYSDASHENEQLRAALERIANETGIFHPQRIAREALSATQGGDE